ncbi:MAG: hypothetical protein WA962_14250 [Ornithinimicrobium sp.]
MPPEKLRPRASNLVSAIWAGQALIAALWIISSLVDGGSFWVWPFGFVWAAFGIVMALRTRRQWVVADNQGISVQAGFGTHWSWTWDQIGDVTPEPPGPLVTHLAVVGVDGRVAQTPLAKGDPRLRELWSTHSRNAGPKAQASPT